MASKDDILRSIRARTPAPSAHPDLAGPWIAYPDRAAKFAESVAVVGGKCTFIDSIERLNDELDSIPEYQAAKKVFSSLAGVRRANVDLSLVADPHDLEDLDFAIFPGHFGVAENGAIWVTDHGLRHRVTYFIAQHLVLVIPADAILDNMHQAYDRLDVGDKRFGAFLSGPSKTADIEQSLVIGAHGPRSLNVFAVGEKAKSAG